MIAGETFAGKYVLERPLGSGGMGTVWIAEQRPLSRKVALKVLKQVRAGAEARFLREMQALGRISNPHVVTVYDSGSADDGTLYIAMELVDGPTLREELHARGRMTPAQSLDVVREIAAGLAAAHAQNVAHFDLKPENVVLQRTSRGRTCKILDFGVARMLDPGPDVLAGEPGAATAEQTVTEEGTAVGTVGYMSPEQLRGVRDDPRSDLYALGVIWFELLTGRGPFGGKTGAELAMEHMVKPPPRASELAPSAVPAEIEAILARLLAKDPANRPETAAALVDALASLSVSSSAATATSTVAAPLVSSTAPTAPTVTAARVAPVPARSSRPRVAALLAIVVGVVVALVAGVVITRGGGGSGSAASAPPTPAGDGRKRIAVLSLVDTAQDPQLGAIAADALASSLAGLDGARIVSPLRVARAERDAKGDPLEAVGRLGVDIAVTGQVNHPGDGVSVVVSLNDMATGDLVEGGRSPSAADVGAAVRKVLPAVRASLTRLLPAQEKRGVSEEMRKTARADGPTVAESTPGLTDPIAQSGPLAAVEVAHKTPEQANGAKNEAVSRLQKHRAPPPGSPGKVGDPLPPSSTFVPTVPEAYRHYMNAFELLESDLAGTQRELELATQLDPACSTLWVHLALIRAGRQGVDDPGVKEALAHVSGALSLRERNVYDVLTALVAHQAALAVARAARFTETSPDEPMAFVLLASARAADHDVAGAVDAVKIARSLDPDMSFSAGMLMDLYASTGKVDDARRVARDFLKRHPANADVARHMSTLAP